MLAFLWDVLASHIEVVTPLRVKQSKDRAPTLFGFGRADVSPQCF